MSPTLSHLNSSVAVPSVGSDFGPFDEETWRNFSHRFHTDVVRFLRLSFETYSNTWDLKGYNWDVCIQADSNLNFSIFQFFICSNSSSYKSGQVKLQL